MSLAHFILAAALGGRSWDLGSEIGPNLSREGEREKGGCKRQREREREGGRERERICWKGTGWFTELKQKRNSQASLWDGLGQDQGLPCCAWVLSKAQHQLLSTPSVPVTPRRVQFPREGSEWPDLALPAPVIRDQLLYWQLHSVELRRGGHPKEG